MSCRTVALLAVDSSGETLSLALRANGRLWTSRRRGRRPHDETLLPALDALLARAGLAPRQLGAIAAASGPGRFTGIRIGMAYAATAARELGIPALAISRFEAIAWKTPGSRVCATVAGWKDERFCQLFTRRSYGPPRAAGEPAWVAAADGPRRREELAARAVVAELATTAADLLAPAEARLARGRVGGFAPLYLKPAHYERTRPPRLVR